MKQRRAFSVSTVLMSMAIFAPLCVRAAPAKPNIVLFLVDDMGWQDTSLPFYYTNGVPCVTALNRRYVTPFMEKMSAEGVLLTSAYAQPVCSPTRCSILTGMNAARHRVTNWTANVNGAPSNLRGPQGGITGPNWAINGIQPLNTPASGTTRSSYNHGGVAYPDTAEVAYTLTKPYTMARTLPQFLSAQGYETFMCGKAHFGAGNGFGPKAVVTPGQNPRLLGFDHNLCGSHKGQPSSYRADNSNASWGGEIFGLKKIKRATDASKQAMLTETLTTDAIALVQREAVAQKKPFFLYLGQFALHTPIGDGVARDAERIVAEDAAADRAPHDGLPWNAFERNYRDLVNGMDAALGQVLTWAETLKRETGRDTIVIFLADNGGLVGKDQRSSMAWNVGNAPLSYGKGSCYEGGIREPMIAWSTDKTRIPAGRVVHTPVICEDLFPTFLEYAGANVAALRAKASLWAMTPGAVYGASKKESVRQEMDGVSLTKLLKTGHVAAYENRPILIHQPISWTGTTSRAYDFFTAMRMGPWKLIYQHDTQAFELYNLDTDISEQNNLAAKFPQQVERLRVVMGKLLRARGAQMPIRVKGENAGTSVPYPDDCNTREIAIHSRGF